MLDTCVLLDLPSLDLAVLPKSSEITAITLAELHQGVAAAKDPTARTARTEELGFALVSFDALPFDGKAAARYGSMVSLTLAAGRDPRPRRLDLMIAAIASVHELPLYTRNTKDFQGLERLVEVVTV
ncbi:MAG TPA: type II toxin-antitoxin system VapC family toxin [Amycolatopsis sp.]|nr:type II toxin-antitoxin system VapC family toxin [Amycolatopsis sp.]